MRKAVLMAQLAGKIAIVTGGSRGIGAAAGHGIAGDVPPMIRRNDGVPYRLGRHIIQEPFESFAFSKSIC
jgi:hypothetical protein